MRELIKINNLCFKYKNKQIFENLTYEFHEGRYIIQGENGGGKSTLLNLIMGFLAPDSGNIEADNLTINYLFQEPMLFTNLTVYENIILKCIAIKSEDRDEIIQKYAEKFNLKDKLDTKIAHLSGGERQRVQLAILSCQKSDVILMDEPIANLDKKNSEEIMKYIFSLECPLVIVVSHQFIEKTANYTLLELKEGKLLEV